MNYELRAPINENYSIIEQILTNRGIKYEDIDHYLSVSEMDNLPSTKLKNIDKAISILLKHIENPES